MRAKHGPSRIARRTGPTGSARTTGPARTAARASKDNRDASRASKAQGQQGQRQQQGQGQQDSKDRASAGPTGPARDKQGQQGQQGGSRASRAARPGQQGQAGQQAGPGQRSASGRRRGGGSARKGGRGGRAGRPGLDRVARRGSEPGPGGPDHRRGIPPVVRPDARRRGVARRPRVAGRGGADSRPGARGPRGVHAGMPRSPTGTSSRTSWPSRSASFATGSPRRSAAANRPMPWSRSIATRCRRSLPRAFDATTSDWGVADDACRPWSGARPSGSLARSLIADGRRRHCPALELRPGPGRPVASRLAGCDPQGARVRRPRAQPGRAAAHRTRSPGAGPMPSSSWPTTARAC